MSYLDKRLHAILAARPREIPEWAAIENLKKQDRRKLKRLARDRTRLEQFWHRIAHANGFHGNPPSDWDRMLNHMERLSSELVGKQ